MKTLYRDDYQLPEFNIDTVHLNIDLYEDKAIVQATMQVKRNPKNKHITNILKLNGEELILNEIMLNEKKLSASDYHLAENLLNILNVPEHFTLAINNTIYPQKNTKLSGLYLSKNTFCTQCEPEGFRRITYFLDHPDVLARYKTTITADKKRFPILLSNGNLIKKDLLENNRHTTTWEDPFKKPSYLFALVAGDFDVLADQFITMTNRTIELKIFVEKGYADQAQHALHSVKEAMRWDEKAYGREYDLDTYMIVAIGDFNMGAMENKGLNIFNTKYVLAKPATATDEDFLHITSVIGHEYFHNWSGNRVTCRDWFQLSLKEGLTIFRDQSFTEDLFSQGVMRIHDVTALRETQFTEDAGPLAHPVRPESYIEINNFYTATVYNKGAEVLRMLQTLLGKELFRKGMDLYFSRYDGEAVTIEDYVACMEEVSSKDLSQFRLWYAQAGTPVVTVREEYDEKAQTYTLYLHQMTAPTPGQPNKYPLHIPIRMALFAENTKTLPLIMNDKNHGEEIVLDLKEENAVFNFTQIITKPIASLLRNFSAPIKLKMVHSDHDLLFLSKHDTDLFNRFEAVQQYSLRILLKLIADYQQEQSLVLNKEFIHLYENLLKEAHPDQLFLAELISLPSEQYIAQYMPIVDVDAIHYVREFVILETATQLASLLQQTYSNLHHPVPYQFNIKEMGRRSLKNKCLFYLAQLPNYSDLCMTQFQSALDNNMTDTLAALKLLSNMNSPLRLQALESFYQAWQQDDLVVDKWLAIQATCKLPHTLVEIKDLTHHEAFDIKNPNKVYALIGAFGQRNAIQFHQKNGAGYHFLRDTVLQLDKLNPQVAARMVKPLTTWKRYDKERQVLMHTQLEAITKEKTLSADVYELVSKSLHEG